MRSQQFDAFERTLLHLHPNNYGHQFFQTNCNNITIKPMCDRIWGDQLAICQFFVQLASKNCEFRFSFQYVKFRDFIHFPIQNNFVQSLSMERCSACEVGMLLGNKHI